VTATIWLVRHGETDWNASRRLQGSTDIELNALGQRQAESVAQHFRTIRFDAIYSSPLVRTAQTALPLARQQQLPLLQETALAERDFGVFQGLTPDDIAAAFPDDFRRWQAREPDFCPLHGESLRDFQTRVKGVLEKIARAHSNQTIAVFSHGGVLDIIYRLAKRLDLQVPRDWPIPNAGIQRLVGSPASFEIVEWGIIDHLRGPTARDELPGIS